MPSSTQPNIIFFFTDQQRWDSTGAHGNPLGLTPNFDRMAHEGAWLYNSFTCQPVCAPARTCPQTGQYATRCGVWRNGIGLPAGQPSLAGEAAPLIQEVVRHPSGQRWVLDEEIDQ